MTRRVLVAILLLAFASPGVRAQAEMRPAPLVTPFSAGHAGSAHPSGWEPVRITETKRPTVYELVDDGGTVVLHARADAAASALAQATSFDVRAAPLVQWRWKIADVIATADNAVAAREDSPVRLILEFDGDKRELPLTERAVFAVSRAVSGRELPYATLMYVWSNRAPVGTIIPNPRTRRVQMVVASSGTGEVGRWQALTRNVLQDFERAFGEPPGRLVGVGVMTDSDNTRTQAEAWYGDIRFVGR